MRIFPAGSGLLKDQWRFPGSKRIGNPSNREKGWPWRGPSIRTPCGTFTTHPVWENKETGRRSFRFETYGGNMKTGEKTLPQDSDSLLGEVWRHFQLEMACSG